MKNSHKMIEVDGELLTTQGIYDIGVIRLISTDSQVFLDYLHAPGCSPRVSLALSPADLLKLKELLEPGPCMFRRRNVSLSPMHR